MGERVTWRKIEKRKMMEKWLDEKMNRWTDGQMERGRKIEKRKMMENRKDR
jgi:hypothetical protein